MTPEQLLRPRYKVIGDYPGSPFEVGSILELTQTLRNRFFHASAHGAWWDKDFDKWPAIFKKLEWWQERTAEELPKYVKWGKDKDILELVGILDEKRYLCTFKVRLPVELQGAYPALVYAGSCTPATETEYNDFINSLKK